MPPYVFPVLGGGITNITSPFGPRSRPGGFGSANHQGIDIGGTRGTPILAPISGEIISAREAGGYGNQVQLRGADGLVHSFSHMDSFNVRPGMTVQAGTPLGELGATGAVTGPHLHYEVLRDGRRINPSGILSQARSAGESILSREANRALDAARGATRQVLDVIVPGSGTAADVVGDIFGVDIFGNGTGSGCGVNPFCYLREWITTSGFFQRLALAILAFILILAAFYLMKGQEFKNLAKGALT